MEEDLLDALLGELDVIPSEIKPVPRLIRYEIDNKTLYPNPARRFYGGYKRLVPREVTVCESLNLNNGQKEYEEMIDDMTRMSLARTRGLLGEKRASRYERKQKAQKSSK